MAATKKKKRVVRRRAPQFRVNHPNTSGGPEFTSLTEALSYIRFCMKDGDYDYMTIGRIKSYT